MTVEDRRRRSRWTRG